MSIFRFLKLETPSDIFLPLLILAAAIFWFGYRYRHDAADISLVARGVLIALRTLALVALFLAFLQPQCERLVGMSRVAILLDSSASMASTDGQEKSRFAIARERIEKSPLVPTLKKKHDVVFYSFEQELAPRDSFAALAPEGEQTKIADAILAVLTRERSIPLGGIILFSDGAQNSGSATDVAIHAVRDARVPIHTIGFGTANLPTSLRIASVEIPERVPLGDSFTVSCQIEQSGTEIITDNKCRVECWLARDVQSTSVKISEHNWEFFETSENIETSRAEFRCEVNPTEAGEYEIEWRIIPSEIRSENLHGENTDDILSVTRRFVVTNRQTRILIVAGGPLRDEQFLVEQIARDSTLEADLVAMWGVRGTVKSVRSPVQSVNRLLETFPTTAAELAEYDLIFAFDPPWREFSAEQLDALEEWLARQSGGLVLVAGAAYTAQLQANPTLFPQVERVRAFYPLEFSASTLTENLYRTSSVPQPIHWTRDEASFLKLDENPLRSRALWDEVGGFYGYTIARAMKPGATLFAHTQTVSAAETAVIFAEQLYGSGRVFFIGSAELWRVRRVDPLHAERLISQIIRHVAQGKSQRQSECGSLTTDKKHYPLGSVAVIHATLNLALSPRANGNENSVDEISALEIFVQMPNSLEPQTFSLAATARGIFQGYLSLPIEGEWSLRLPLSENDQTLTQTFEVSMSDWEKAHTARDDKTLHELSLKTEGRAFDGATFFAAENEVIDFANSLRVRSYRAQVDRARTEFWLHFLLGSCLVALITEWSLRRVWKLA